MTRHEEETRAFIVARYGTRPNCKSGPPNIDRTSSATRRGKRVKEINAMGHARKENLPRENKRERG